jgi:hypothetical protein
MFGGAMLETIVFFGETPKATRDYAEWFNANKPFAVVEVSIATRPIIGGGSETVIIVVFQKE